MENNTPSQPPFKIGDRVVCIEDPLKADGLFRASPNIKYKGIYTVCWLGYQKGWLISNKKNWFVELQGHEGVIYDYSMFALVPPRHESVEIAEDILKMKIVEERSDVITEKILND